MSDLYKYKWANMPGSPLSVVERMERMQDNQQIANQSCVALANFYPVTLDQSLTQLDWGFQTLDLKRRTFFL